MTRRRLLRELLGIALLIWLLLVLVRPSFLDPSPPDPSPRLSAYHPPWERADGMAHAAWLWLRHAVGLP